jgi:anti-sigma B factor antagonist
MQTDERRGATPDGNLSWNTLRSSGEVIVHVFGELDMATAPTLSDLLQRIENEGERSIVVDLAGLEFCDSSGLRALVVLHQRAERTGLRLVLRSPAPPVQRLFELTNTDALLERG